MLREGRRQTAMLSAEVTWERYLRQQASAQLRELQLERLTVRGDSIREQNYLGLVAALEDEVEAKGRELLRERQIAKQHERDFREQELVRNKRFNVLEAQRLAAVTELTFIKKELEKAEAARAVLEEVAANQNTRLQQLTEEIKGLVSMRDECRAVRADLSRFKAQAIIRGWEQADKAVAEVDREILGAKIKTLLASLQDAEQSANQGAERICDLEGRLEASEEARGRLVGQLATLRRTLEQQAGRHEDQVRLLKERNHELLSLAPILGGGLGPAGPAAVAAAGPPAAWTPPRLTAAAGGRKGPKVVAALAALAAGSTSAAHAANEGGGGGEKGD